MRSISALTATLIGLGALMVTGCNDTNENQRLVVEVTRVNDGGPVVSAFLTGKDDTPRCDGTDAMPIDVIPVEFTARPYNAAMIINPGDPFSTFEITSYDVIWHTTSAFATQLTASNIFGAGTSLMVPIDELSTVDVLLADATLKTQPWFAAAVSPCGGTGAAFAATAELRFHGHESGSPDTEIVIPAQVAVNFVGYVKSSGK